MKKSKKQLIKNAKGITLVALVVTIVMMLILVGITMVAVLGDNGVISKAKMQVINMRRQKLTKYNI